MYRWWFPVNPPPCFRLCFILPLLHEPTLLFTYLEILLLMLVAQIPIHSCPRFAVNCSPLAASPTPRHPMNKVTYLHRWHQQHQLSCLTQLFCLHVGLFCWTENVPFENRSLKQRVDHLERTIPVKIYIYQSTVCRGQNTLHWKLAIVKTY